MFSPEGKELLTYPINQTFGLLYFREKILASYFKVLWFGKTRLNTMYRLDRLVPKTLNALNGQGPGDCPLSFGRDIDFSF